MKLLACSGFLSDDSFGSTPMMPSIAYVYVLMNSGDSFQFHSVMRSAHSSLWMSENTNTYVTPMIPNAYTMHPKKLNGTRCFT